MSEEADDDVAAVSDRLMQLRADLERVLPTLSAIAGKTTKRTAAGRAFRAAVDRLAAEVLT